MKLSTLVVLSFLIITQNAFSENPFPEWTQGAVWYHIVPERFRNSNPNNDPSKQQVMAKDGKDWQVHPWASDWYKLQIWESPRQLSFDELAAQRRYGGDLLGVMEKLPYLKDLGVNVIYLAPVFESPSIMKYDAATFHHIDDNFGFARGGEWQPIPPDGRMRPDKKMRPEKKKDAEKKTQPETEDPKTWTLTPSDEIFVGLVEKAHEEGMRVVISSVFNYCGKEFWAFRDVQEKQQKSAYKDWFEVFAWDDPATPDTVEFIYKSWRGNRNSPLFRRDEQGLIAPVKKYIFDSTRRWLDPNNDGNPADGIDGWSVYEAKSLDEAFVDEWVKLVKSINPNVITLADEMESTSANAARFDLIFTNNFSDLVNGFFVRREYPLAEFQKKIELSDDDKASSVLSGIHRLSDHQTDRIATIIRNAVSDDSSHAVLQNNHGYDPCKPSKAQREIQKALTFFQLTFPGAPMILFGDESGMWGGDRRDLIKPMLWREFDYEKETYSTIRPDLGDTSENVVDNDLFQLYRQLNRIRRDNPALQRGDFKIVLFDDEKNIIAFRRQYARNEVLVVFNNGDKKQEIEIPTGWKDDSKVKDGMKDQKYRVQNGNIKVELEKKSGTVVINWK